MDMAWAFGNQNRVVAPAYYRSDDMNHGSHRALGTIFGVDTHVLMGKIGSPDGLGDRAPLQVHSNLDFFLVHLRLPLGLGIARCTSASLGDTGVIEIDINQGNIQILHFRTSNSRQDAPPVRVT